MWASLGAFGVGGWESVTICPQDEDCAGFFGVALRDRETSVLGLDVLPDISLNKAGNMRDICSGHDHI